MAGGEVDEPERLPAVRDEGDQRDQGRRDAHDYAQGLKALKAGKRIQYVGASGPLAFDAYHSAEREFSYDAFDAATN